MKIKTLVAMAAVVWCACSKVQEGPPLKDEVKNETIIPISGNTYVVDGRQDGKVGNDGIEYWKSNEAVFNTYLRSDKASNINLMINVPAVTGKSTIEIKIGSQRKRIDILPSQASLVEIGEFNVPEGYVKIEMRGISKDNQNFPLFKELVIGHQLDAGNFSFVKDNEDNRFYWGRRGPSVHLTYTLPEDESYQWFYNEITVPEGQDPVGSYFMANGFAEGYFGIQVNSEEERRVLFSVWSPFQTDNPEDIPEEQKIKLLKKGKEVNTGEFGNEGSGGQSFLKYNWEPGKTYKFLNSIEPDGNGNTVYTAFFKTPENENWQLIASFLRPQTDTWYKRPHSFLENFIDRNGYIPRKSIYKNQWARDINGNWKELTEAKFTGDDIAKRGYRMDYAGGVESNQFFLENGGFFNENTVLNSIFLRAAGNNSPAIDFQRLD